MLYGVLFLPSCNGDPCKVNFAFILHWKVYGWCTSENWFITLPYQLMLPSQCATAAEKGLSQNVAEDINLPFKCEKRGSSFLCIPQNVYSKIKRFGLNHYIVN